MPHSSERPDQPINIVPIQLRRKLAPPCAEAEIFEVHGYCLAARIAVLEPVSRAHISLAIVLSLSNEPHVQVSGHWALFLKYATARIVHIESVAGKGATEPDGRRF